MYVVGACDSEVCSVRACKMMPVRVYDSDVCSTCALRYIRKIGHFGHTLGASWITDQHKLDQWLGQNRTKHPSFTLNFELLTK